MIYLVGKVHGGENTFYIWRTHSTYKEHILHIENTIYIFEHNSNIYDIPYG